MLGDFVRQLVLNRLKYRNLQSGLDHSNVNEAPREPLLDVVRAAATPFAWQSDQRQNVPNTSPPNGVDNDRREPLLNAERPTQQRLF